MMLRWWTVRVCLCLLVIHAVASESWAFKREMRLPLSGCRGHYNASGTARYLAIRNVPKEKDREELIVEIFNVPLKPGTVLVVYVGDEQVGQITLDAKRYGSLTLTSDFRKYVPPLDVGTSVMLKTVEGQMVMW
jgi:hypothetical protein